MPKPGPSRCRAGLDDAWLRRGNSLLEPGPLAAQPVLEFPVGDLDVFQQYRRLDRPGKFGQVGGVEIDAYPVRVEPDPTHVADQAIAVTLAEGAADFGQGLAQARGALFGPAVAPQFVLQRRPRPAAGRSQREDRQ